jgi:outer membrane protein TolC
MVKNQLDLRQAEINQHQQENAIKLSVLNAWIALEQAREAYNTALAARKLQQEAADGEQRRYERGNSTVQNVVQLQRDLVNAQASEVTALNAYVRARTNLDLVLGRILDVHNVDLQEAYSGVVKRSAGPLPAVDQLPPGPVR